jgi:hypothetical protein
MHETVANQVLRVLETFPDVHITRDQALGLTHGDILHYAPVCNRTVGPRGGVKVKVERWRVNGKVKTWKRSPDRFEIPIKFGLYGFSYLTDSNCDQFHLASDCPEGIAY